MSRVVALVVDNAVRLSASDPGSGEHPQVLLHAERDHATRFDRVQRLPVLHLLVVQQLPHHHGSLNK